MKIKFEFDFYSVFIIIYNIDNFYHFNIFKASKLNYPIFRKEFNKAL